MSGPRTLPTEYAISVPYPSTNLSRLEDIRITDVVSSNQDVNLHLGRFLEALSLSDESSVFPLVVSEDDIVPSLEVTAAILGLVIQAVLVEYEYPSRDSHVGT